jgi:DNA-binding transcriptional LysR family regulator
VLVSHGVMEIRQLSAFVAVAEEGAFTRAAERLGIVQPAVSQAVRRLEDELGIVLFERSSRRVTVTGAGEAFLPHARAVLGRLDDAARVASELAAGRGGVVRLATALGAPELVHALLAEHRAAHPGVRVELRRSRRSPKLQAVLDGETDVALVHSAPRTPGLAFTEVSSEPWRAVVAAGHALAGHGPIALRALADDPLVLVDGEGTGRLREQLSALCLGAGFEPLFGPAQPSRDDALVEIARSSAWTLFRANVPETRRLGLAELVLEDDLPPARLWLAHRTDPTPATRSLVALARRLYRGGRLAPPPAAPGAGYADRSG